MKRRMFRLAAVAVGLVMIGSTAGLNAAGAAPAAPAADTAKAAATGNIVATAQAAGGFSTLLAAAQAAGLVDTLTSPGPFTVFAPTDAAFAKLLAALKLTPQQLLAQTNLVRAVLLYHVVPGRILSTDLAAVNTPATAAQGLQLRVTKDAGGVTVNGYAKVVAADVLATNGVIHVIDNVLLPLPPKPAPNIVEVAASAGSFNTLLAAAKAAGLVDALSGPGPITVFAPTDRAFATLLRRLGLTPQKLLANPALVARILTYHVVPGKILSTDLKARNVVTTLNGNRITVRKSGSGVTVNRTAVVRQADITASNGVIHVIDRVLVPVNWRG